MMGTNQMPQFSAPPPVRTVVRSAPAPPTGAGARAMSNLSRMEEQQQHQGGDDQDQVRTFCTEGTPMNFLSTATSMNELNRVSRTRRYQSLIRPLLPVYSSVINTNQCDGNTI